jgi:hypothetical protein
MTRRKRSNNDLQNTTHKTKDWAARTSLMSLLQIPNNTHIWNVNQIYIVVFKCSMIVP